MEILTTGKLKVMAAHTCGEKQIVINPNDGFDLGLMMTEASVLFSTGFSADVFDSPDAPVTEGTVIQKNECRLGTLELSSRVSEKIGSPKEVRLHLVRHSPLPKLLITPA
jgi:hypothetical protein